MKSTSLIYQHIYEEYIAHVYAWSGGSQMDRGADKGVDRGGRSRSESFQIGQQFATPRRPTDPKHPPVIHLLQVLTNTQSPLKVSLWDKKFITLPSHMLEHRYNADT